MEDFLYAYNQPKHFAKYDLFLDGKITANEVVYKVLTEDNKYENINLIDKLKELESKLQTHFTFEHVSKLPTVGKETVIYLVPNDENSGDSYNEYMWVKKEEGEGEFELIGSGSYAQQKADLGKEIENRTNADTELNTKIEAESDRAKKAEETLTTNLAQEVEYRTKAVSDEEARAKAAEKTLTNNLDDEVKIRTDADSVLGGKIVAEEERAKGEEGRIELKLDEEIANRIADVNAEEQRAKDEEGRIESKLNEEI